MDGSFEDGNEALDEFSESFEAFIDNLNESKRAEARALVQESGSEAALDFGGGWDAGQSQKTPYTPEPSSFKRLYPLEVEQKSYFHAVPVPDGLGRARFQASPQRRARPQPIQEQRDQRQRSYQGQEKEWEKTRDQQALQQERQRVRQIQKQREDEKMYEEEKERRRQKLQNPHHADYEEELRGVYGSDGASSIMGLTFDKAGVEDRFQQRLRDQQEDYDYEEDLRDVHGFDGSSRILDGSSSGAGMDTAEFYDNVHLVEDSDSFDISDELQRMNAERAAIFSARPVDSPIYARESAALFDSEEEEEEEEEEGSDSSDSVTSIADALYALEGRGRTHESEFRISETPSPQEGQTLWDDAVLFESPSPNGSSEEDVYGGYAWKAENKYPGSEIWVDAKAHNDETLHRVWIPQTSDIKFYKKSDAHDQANPREGAYFTVKELMEREWWHSDATMVGETVNKKGPLGDLKFCFDCKTKGEHGISPFSFFLSAFTFLHGESNVLRTYISEDKDSVFAPYLKTAELTKSITRQGRRDKRITKLKLVVADILVAIMLWDILDPKGDRPEVTLGGMSVMRNFMGIDHPVSAWFWMGCYASVMSLSKFGPRVVVYLTHLSSRVSGEIRNKKNLDLATRLVADGITSSTYSTTMETGISGMLSSGNVQLLAFGFLDPEGEFYFNENVAFLTNNMHGGLVATEIRRSPTLLNLVSDWGISNMADAFLTRDAPRDFLVTWEGQTVGECILRLLSSVKGYIEMFLSKGDTTIDTMRKMNTYDFRKIVVISKDILLKLQNYFSFLVSDVSQDKSLSEPVVRVQDGRIVLGYNNTLSWTIHNGHLFAFLFLAESHKEVAEYFFKEFPFAHGGPVESWKSYDNMELLVSTKDYRWIDGFVRAIRDHGVYDDDGYVGVTKNLLFEGLRANGRDRNSNPFVGNEGQSGPISGRKRKSTGCKRRFNASPTHQCLSCLARGEGKKKKSIALL